MAAPNGVRTFHRMTNRPEPDTVLLVGCGRGEEIPVMRRRWPRARIIGVEALAEHWSFMRKAAQEPNVMVKGAAYHTEGEKLLFHLNYEPDQRATIYDLPVPMENELTREIETVSIDGVVERHGIGPETLLWIDIEGGEYEALRGSQTLADQKIRWVNIELNFTPPRNMPPWLQVHQVLEGYGYRMMAMHSVAKNGRQADAIYIRESEWEQVRKANAISGKQRKLERLISGRGRTEGNYRHPRG